MKRIITKIVAGGCLAALLIAPTSAQLGYGGDNVVNKMMGVHKFDTMIELMRISDLTFRFEDHGPYTIFAPTDQAFDRLSQTQMEKLRTNRDLARKFVLSHVVRGSFTAQQAVRRGTLSALDGSKIRFRNVRGHGMAFGNIGFQIANVKATNGVLHGLDSVGALGM